ncbi:hypothetical protein [Paeniglutamicibacter sp.]|uniref:hypothetical protein n=1 Tax=Paeniglutamicibacter sp. TaxID=1934391 RepID=UPI00398A36FA
METRQELVDGFAVEYAKGTKGQKGVMLDYLCAATGWSRANARRRVVAALRKPARGVPVPLPRRRPRKYGPAALKLLERIWTLSGEPCGKYLAPIMADELERLDLFDELGPVAGCSPTRSGTSCSACRPRRWIGT